MIVTHRPQSSSFLGVPYRILNMNPQKELLWGPWVTMIPRVMIMWNIRAAGAGASGFGGCK